MQLDTHTTSELAMPPRELKLPNGAATVIVADPEMAELYELVGRLGPSDLPVLVTGETGAGKELVATAVHAYSSRASSWLVTVNCAAVHESLAESELFGHERGAFSGAVTARVGWLEAASGSTLFLDEVGELSLHLQAKLLRVLEVHRVTRVGETREREVDVRLVAATNRDLEDEVNAGRFRRDLYYRLSAAVLHVPPLRRRLGEILPLATRFLDDACARARRNPMQVSEGAAKELRGHAWPGNIRELKNTMQYLAATVAAETLLDEHVVSVLKSTRTAVPEASLNSFAAVDSTDPGVSPTFRPLGDELRELEITRMTQALAATGGNQTRAAQLLSMPIRTFFEKAKQYGLTPRRKSAES